MGASESLTLLGMTAPNTRPGKFRLTSSATSAERRVRPSNMVSTTPRVARVGFSMVATRRSVLRSWVSPSSA
jgi:hypothetical protein